MNARKVSYHLQNKTPYHMGNCAVVNRLYDHQGSLVLNPLSRDLRNTQIRSTSYLLKTPRVHEDADKRESETYPVQDNND